MYSCVVFKKHFKPSCLFHLQVGVGISWGKPFIFIYYLLLLFIYFNKESERTPEFGEISGLPSTSFFINILWYFKCYIHTETQHVLTFYIIRAVFSAKRCLLCELWVVLWLEASACWQIFKQFSIELYALANIEQCF